jgi:hypothetical protein
VDDGEKLLTYFNSAFKIPLELDIFPRVPKIVKFCCPVLLKYISTNPYGERILLKHIFRRMEGMILHIVKLHLYQYNVNNMATSAVFLIQIKLFVQMHTQPLATYIPLPNPNYKAHDLFPHSSSL